jgi:hypothetical protein
MRRCITGLFPAQTSSQSKFQATFQPNYLVSFCNVFAGKKCGTATNFAVAIATSIALSLVVATGAIANPAESTPSQEGIPIAVSTQDIDSSIVRDYEPATVYLPDPQTQQLVPQSVLVTADEPAAGAVAQIMQAYQGQDVGIRDYEVSVNDATHKADINFNINNPRGARVFESLSSANQYSLFEAIRETLLTQPIYSVNDIIFRANGIAFDI